MAGVGYATLLTCSRSSGGIILSSSGCKNCSRKNHMYFVKSISEACVYNDKETRGLAGGPTYQSRSDNVFDQLLMQS